MGGTACGAARSPDEPSRGSRDGVIRGGHSASRTRVTPPVIARLDPCSVRVERRGKLGLLPLPVLTGRGVG